MAQEIILDLSGLNGLADGFSGDTDLITSRPETILMDKSRALAGGLFNPYIRRGYLAPTTTTRVDLSVSDTLTLPFNSVEYDSINNYVYWSGNTNKIYKQTSLTDLSLDALVTLTSGSVVNDISMYEVDGKPSLVYTYDYPANTTDKENAVFIGYKSVVATEVPIMSKYDPIILGEASASFTIKSSGPTKLAQPVAKNELANTDLATVKLSDVFLKLRRSTSGQTQVWNMKLSLYSASLSSTADGQSHYIPNTLLGSSVVAASVLEDGFTDVQFKFSSDITIESSYFVIVLEPETPGDVTGNEGVEWLAGNTSVSNNYNGLYYDVSGYYQLTIDNVYMLSYKTGLAAEENVLSDTDFSLSTDIYSPESVSESFSFPAGNISQAVTIGTKPSNIVVVAISINSATDQLATITINGQSMTLLNQGSPTSNTFMYVYYREGVSSGSRTIVTTGISVESKMVVSTHYGIKPGSIDLFSSGTAISDSDANDMIAGPYLPKRSIAMYITSIEYKQVAGPDYYRADGYGLFGNPAPDSVYNPGSEAQPLTVAVWEANSVDQYPEGESMHVRKYDNDVYDGIINGSFRYVWLTISPLDSTSDEESYWNLTGKRSGKAFLRLATNGYLYLFTDRAIHKFDGTTLGSPIGTLTRDIIQFPEYHTITDAIMYRSRFYIGTNAFNINRDANPTENTYSGSAGIYVWGGNSTVLGDDDFIELPGVREVRKIYASPDGQLRLITISNNGTVELRQFGYNDSGGVVFPVIKKMGIGAFPKTPDGVKTAGDKTVWLANDGKIYCDSNGVVTILHEVKTAGTTTANTISNITSGSLFFGSGDETGSTGFRSNKQALTFSYLDGGVHSVKKIYPFDITTGANATQTPHTGSVYTAVSYVPITSVVRNVRIYNAPISGTGSTVIATVKMFFNQSTTASHPYGMTKSITKSEAKRGYVDFKVHQPNIHAIQLCIDWDTGTPIGSDMYLPNTAVITYDETKVQSPDNG